MGTDRDRHFIGDDCTEEDGAHFDALEREGCRCGPYPEYCPLHDARSEVYRGAVGAPPPPTPDHAKDWPNGCPTCKRAFGASEQAAPPLDLDRALSASGFPSTVEQAAPPLNVERLRIEFESEFDDQWPEWMAEAWDRAVARLGSAPSRSPDVDAMEQAIGHLLHEGYEIRYWSSTRTGEFGVVSAQEFSETLAARLGSAPDAPPLNVERDALLEFGQWLANSPGRIYDLQDTIDSGDGDDFAAFVDMYLAGSAPLEEGEK